MTHVEFDPFVTPDKVLFDPFVPADKVLYDPPLCPVSPDPADTPRTTDPDE